VEARMFDLVGTDTRVAAMEPPLLSVPLQGGTLRNILTRTRGR
jgi:hypothetical protein